MFCRDNHHRKNFNGYPDQDTKGMLQLSGSPEKEKYKVDNKTPIEKNRKRIVQKGGTPHILLRIQSPQKYLQMKPGPRCQNNCPTRWKG